LNSTSIAFGSLIFTRNSTLAMSDLLSVREYPPRPENPSGQPHPAVTMARSPRRPWGLVATA
jgi:hypothetical protein